MIFLLALSFEAKAALEFTDSLHMIMHNQKIVNTGDGNALQFDISVCRPNVNWNDGDFFLGEADFYFTFNDKAFEKAAAPKLILTNEKIDQGVGTQKLFASADTWWASSSKRLRVKVTSRANVSAWDLKIPHIDTLFIARVQWKVAAGNRDPKIEWDMTASGALTANNFPIIPAFEGSIDKYPNPGIFIDRESDSRVQACEGSDVLFFVNARSTGDSIRYKWQVSNGSDFKDLERTAGLHTCAELNFDYLLHGAGDTLVIRHAPGHTDHLNLQCVISDPTLPSSEYRTTMPKELLLRDSIRVFLSAASNTLETGGTEIKMCPTSAGTKIRLNVSGPAYDERNEVLDVYVEYNFIAKSGSLMMFKDTVRTLSSSYNNAALGTLYFKELNIKDEGTYYVTKTSTSHCYDLPASTPPLNLGGVKLDTLLGNALAYAEYDTLNAIFSTSPDTTILEKMSIAMDVDTNLMVGLAGSFDQVYNLYDSHKTPWLGEVVFRPNPYNDTVYHSKAAGTDTVMYVKMIGECPEVSMREVEVIDNYYVQIKVNLEGPMMNGGEMRCFTIYSFPSSSDKTLYESSYNDKLSIAVSKFETDPDTYEKELPMGGHWCDWIFVKIRDNSGVYIDSTSALLRQDGVICDIEGNPYIAFKKIEKGKMYNVIIEHRNHLSIMSANTYSFSHSSSAPTLIDLTQPSNIYDSGDPSPLALVFGKYCIYAGDLNQDGFVTATDAAELYIAGESRSVYGSDINQDGMAAMGTDNPFIDMNNSKGILYLK